MMVTQPSAHHSAYNIITHSMDVYYNQVAWSEKKHGQNFSQVLLFHIRSNDLDHRRANFFFERSNSKCFRLCRWQIVSVTYAFFQTL